MDVVIDSALALPAKTYPPCELSAVPTTDNSHGQAPKSFPRAMALSIPYSLDAKVPLQVQDMKRKCW